VRFRAAMHPTLDYVEFRTNPKPYMVQGVVHGRVQITFPPLYSKAVVGQQFFFYN
jgi:hypothetical protein